MVVSHALQLPKPADRKEGILTHSCITRRMTVAKARWQEERISTHGCITCITAVKAGIYSVLPLLLDSLPLHCIQSC